MLPSGSTCSVICQCGFQGQKKPSVKAYLVIYSHVLDVSWQCMSVSSMLGFNLNFSSCANKDANPVTFVKGKNQWHIIYVTTTVIQVSGLHECSYSAIPWPHDSFWLEIVETINFFESNYGNWLFFIFLCISHNICMWWSFWYEHLEKGLAVKINWLSLESFVAVSFSWSYVVSNVPIRTSCLLSPLKSSFLSSDVLYLSPSLSLTVLQNLLLPFLLNHLATIMNHDSGS